MVSFDQAIGIVASDARPLSIERIAIEAAGDRVLARPVLAQRSAPARDVSAMDGYAVRDADLAADWTSLRIVGESFAGRGFGGALSPGAAVRIFTGAPTPAGADRVVLQEDARRVDDQVLVPGPPAGKCHIRKAGSDFRLGEILVAAGQTLGPAQLVAAAAADLAEVEVFVQPRVVVVATGDELRRPGHPTDADSIPESVSFGVAQMARRYGAVVRIRQRLPDDLDRMRLAARELVEQADVIVMIGGASVGERDFSKAMFAEAGLAPLFSKVAMRPGKPVWFGRAAGARVLGLPGNPTAAMVTARLFLAPLLAGLRGLGPASALRWVSRPLAGTLEPAGDREGFVGARLQGQAVQPFANRESSGQKTLGELEALIRRPPCAPASAPSERVATLDF